MKAIFTCLVLSLLCYIAIGQKAETTLATKLQNIAQASVSFIENKGQLTDRDGKAIPSVLFSTSTPGLDLYITTTGLTYMFVQPDEQKPIKEATPASGSAFIWERADMILEGASIRKENVIMEGPSPNSFHYFYAHCPEGISGVKAYEKITIKAVYPGIDWVLYNKAKEGFKYDFIVHPGANPEIINMVYRALNPVKPDPSGNISLTLRTGQLRENAPYSYLQETQEMIPSSFRVSTPVQKENYIESRVNVTLKENSYPTSRTLVIDPQLFWASFFGGNQDDVVNSIDTDASGNLFVTGYTNSNAFPTISAGGAYQGSTVGPADRDVFILKFGPGGAQIWATYYGGGKTDEGRAIETDAMGNVFVSGSTASGNFPLQNAGSFFQAALTGSHDGFILKFDNNGIRQWATYYGGQNVAGTMETAQCLATDAAGNLFVAGHTTAPDLPVQNAGTYFQGNISQYASDLFLLKFDNAGNRLWASYYGSAWPTSIAVDPGGNIFISGNVNVPVFPVQNAGTFFQGALAGQEDMVILKFSNTGQRLWATFYGGQNTDNAGSIACDSNGNLYVAGSTQSANFPVQAGSVFFQGALSGNMDATILKFDNAGNRLWASFFGGSGTSGTEGAVDLDIDKCDNIFFTVLINTNQNTPLKPFCDGGYQANSLKGTETDNLIVNLSGTGALLWSTYFGGDYRDGPCYIALDHSGNLFTSFTVFGGSMTMNPSYPLVNPGGTNWYNFNKTGVDLHISKFLAPGFSPPVFSYTSPYCGASTTLIPVTAPGFSGGGIFSSGSGLNIDPATGGIFTGASVPGTYTVTYVPLVCGCQSVSSTSTTVTIGITPTVNVNNAVLCGNTSTVLNASVDPASGNSYTWVPGGVNSTSLLIHPTGSGSYTLIVSSTEGCTAIAVAQVTVFQGVPPISIQPVHICAGNSATLNTQASASLNYSWMPGGQTTPSVVVSPASTTVYSVTVSVGSCSAVIFSSVLVEDISNPVLGFSYNTPLCINNPDPQPDTLPGFSAGGSYSALPGLSIDPLSGSIYLSASSPGTYLVSYSVPAVGCKNPGNNTTIVVIETPQVLSLPSQIRLSPGTSTVLTVSGGNSYTWSPAEWLSCINCPDPAVTAPQDMVYCVSSASNNCLSKACIQVNVNCENGHDFSVPNSFTPNGDHINDAFCLQGWNECLKQFSVLIFNRWGERVYESNDPGFCWDGVYKDQVLTPDVYVFVIQAEYTDHRKINKRGNISLIR